MFGAKGHTALVAQLVASDLCDHNPEPGQPRGMEGLQWVVEMIRRGVPDMQMTTEVLVAEGDRVVDHWTSSGTQTGELFGHPPSGKRFTMTGTGMYRISSGKIAEIWHMEDTLAMMQQLGAIPGASQAETATGPSAAAKAPSSNGGKTLSADEKRSLIRRAYLEYVDRGNATAADELMTPDFIGHYSGMPPLNSREEFKQFIAMHSHRLFEPSCRHCRHHRRGRPGGFPAYPRGKHTGNLMGIPPTGKQVSGSGLSVFRFEGDRVAEEWYNTGQFRVAAEAWGYPRDGRGRGRRALLVRPMMGRPQ